MGSAEACPVVLGIGADPGRHGGVALVERRVGLRPLLHAVWELKGEGRIWFRRCKVVHENLVFQCRSLGVHPESLLYYVERPPPVSRKGTLKGDKRGQQTWYGMGRYTGKIEAVWSLLSGGEVVLLDQAKWTSCLHPHVRGHKVGGGVHRVTEALFLVEGVDHGMSEVSSGCRIDCAEAILLAVVAANHASLQVDTTCGG